MTLSKKLFHRIFEEYLIPERNRLAICPICWHEAILLLLKDPMFYVC